MNRIAIQTTAFDAQVPAIAVGAHHSPVVGEDGVKPVDSWSNSLAAATEPGEVVVRDSPRQNLEIRLVHAAIDRDWRASTRNPEPNQALFVVGIVLDDAQPLMSFGPK